jgi:hypothetical protein
MHHQAAVLRRYPEAMAVEEPLRPSPGPWGQRGRWSVYAEAGTDARMLGHGATKDQAWANSAPRLAKANRKLQWLAAG